LLEWVAARKAVLAGKSVVERREPSQDRKEKMSEATDRIKKDLLVLKPED